MAIILVIGVLACYIAITVAHNDDEVNEINQNFYGTDDDMNSGIQQTTENTEFILMMEII